MSSTNHLEGNVKVDLTRQEEVMEYICEKQPARTPGKQVDSITGGNGMTRKLATVGILSSALLSSAFGADSAAARLQKVEDRQAIEQLLMGDYPRALDRNDWAAYASFFTRDGTLIMGGGATKVTGSRRD